MSCQRYMFVWMCVVGGLTRVLADLSRRLTTNWRLCILFALERQRKKSSGAELQRCHAPLCGLSKPGIVRIFIVCPNTCIVQVPLHTYSLRSRLSGYRHSPFTLCITHRPPSPPLAITPIHLPCSVAQTLQHPSTPSFSDLPLPSSPPQ